MGRRKSIDKEDVLDAAVAVIRRVGVQNLTLEAVAQQAGISKGGLIYNFPSKDEMLVLLLQRSLSRLHAAILAEADSRRDEAFAELQTFFAISLKRSQIERRRGIRLIASLGEKPEFLKVIRLFFRRMTKTIDVKTEEGRRARLAFMAAMGAFYFDGLGHMEMKDTLLRDIIGDAAALLEE